MILFTCTFRAESYTPSQYHIDWLVTFQNGSVSSVKNNSNYYVETKNNCPFTNGTFCCYFTTELCVHAAVPLNNTMINCTAMLIDGLPTPTSGGSYLSKLSIICTLQVIMTTELCSYVHEYNKTQWLLTPMVSVNKRHRAA